MITASSLGDTCYFQCKLCHVNDWVFVGVGADLALDGKRNFSASTTYGWETNTATNDSMDNEQYIGG